MKPSFLKQVPQEIQNHWFILGFTKELKSIKSELLEITENHALVKKLDNLSKKQLLIIFVFNIPNFSFIDLLEWMSEVDLELSDCVELIPYLQNTQLFYYLRNTQPELMPRIGGILQERIDELMNYFLKYDQVHIVHFLNTCEMGYIKTWVQDNHAKILKFCFHTTKADWYLELLPFLDEKVVQRYVAENESLIYDKMNCPLLPVLINRMKAYFPNVIQEFIYTKHFSFFNALIQNRYFSLFEQLFDFLKEKFNEGHPRVNLLRLFIYTQDFRALYLAVKHGNLDFIRWVNQMLPGELAKILKSTSFLALKIAVAYHHDDILNFLSKQTGKHQMLHHSLEFGCFENEDFDGDLLNIAIQYNQIERRDEFFQKICEYYSPDELFFNNDFHLLNSAAISGNLSNLEWILHQAQIISPAAENLDNLIINAKFEPFILAAIHGHIHVLEWLIQRMNPNLFDELFLAFDKFFRASYQNEVKYKLPLLEWLYELFGERINEILIGRDFASLKNLLSLGDWEVMDWIFDRTGCSIESLPPQVQLEMLEMAINLGHVEFVSKMMTCLGPKKFNRITQGINSQHLVYPLSPEIKTWLNGHTVLQLPIEPTASSHEIDLEMPSLDDIEVLDIKTLKKTAKSNNYLMFENCVKHGLLDCIIYLSKKLPKLFFEVLIRDEYNLIKKSLDFQQFAVFDFLVMKLVHSDDDVLLPIMDWLELFFVNENIATIIWIFETGLLNIQALNSKDFKTLLDFLIQSDSLMVMDFVFPRLKPQINQVVADNIHYINILINHEFFTTVEELLTDVRLFDDYETFIYQPENRDEQCISFLVELVEKYFVDIFEQGQFSERIDFLYHLVRYSIKHTRHDAWVKKVIDLPEFQSVASQHDNQLLKLCIEMQDNEVMALLLAISEVRLMAQEHQFYAAEQRVDIGEESAMRSLSCFDQENLKLAVEHYEPQLQLLSESLVIQRLKLRLQKEYSKNPAVIHIKSQKVILPLNWDKFQELSLGHYQKRALKAYYAHSVHTALRFMTMPNHWIHPDMNPALIEVDAQGQKGAAIKPFLSLIAILYLAVNDREMIPIEGHTMESRWQNFYLELALAGRAHNCEKKVVVIDANGDEAQHEVDDMEADKPTCQRGILRHLYQSVLGHPLFTCLTQDMLKQDLNSFVYRYYLDLLDVESARRLQSAFDRYIEELDADAFQVLQTFNIPEDRQVLFITELKTQYKTKLTSSLEQFLKDKLRLEATDAHVIRFHQSSVQQVLDALLRKRKAEEKSAEPKRYRPQKA